MEDNDKKTVIALGASAGGLEALEQFFQKCPNDMGASFVVIQHLSPDHKSLMDNLLRRETEMPVDMITQTTSLEPNHVYLIPPGKIMTYEEGALHLRDKTRNDLMMPIDLFFKSLSRADDCQVIAIILSGTGSDGTRGAMSVNAAGGLLMVQDPDEAAFDGMPRSLLNTQLSDYCISVSAMPALIARLIGNPVKSALSSDDAVTSEDDETDAVTLTHMERIYQLMLMRTEMNLMHYKRATVLRRLERRMQVRECEDYSAYLDLLISDASEVYAFQRELLIGVTSFFRDAEVFAYIQAHVIPAILRKTDNMGTVRVWIAGCSTGEEAYSIAILLHEACASLNIWPSLKIFATDINGQSVEFAASGEYTEAIRSEISPNRMDRFFSKNGDNYQIRKTIRKTIVFARHDLLSDPPFLRMDLVLCRNTMIYFTKDAQQTVLAKLAYALSDDGFLVLGTSEAVNPQDFGLLGEEGHKIYRRGKRAANTGLGFMSRTVPQLPRIRSLSDDETHRIASEHPAEEGLRVLQQSYTPPAILFDGNNRALHFYGAIAPFVRMRAGGAGLDLVKILIEPLIAMAHALIFKTRRMKSAQRSEQIRLEKPGEAGKEQLVRLSCKIANEDDEHPLILLCFELSEVEIKTDTVSLSSLDDHAQKQIIMLENELENMRENLQSTIEQLETSNEELQATNEELMASNEELQSSNEELQSLNEEINTVNAEYQEKLNIVNRLNADLDSMNKAVGVSMIFVDHQIQVQRFSVEALELFRLREHDIGRPISDITHDLHYPDFAQDLEKTVMTGRVLERKITDRAGHLYLVRILPYQVIGTHGQHAVATFIDLTAHRDLDRLQSIMDALPEHLAVLNFDGTIAMVNHSWRQFAKANGDPELKLTDTGTNYLDVCRASTEDPDGHAEIAYKRIQSILEGTHDSFSLTYPCHSPTEERWFHMVAKSVKDQEYAAVVSHIEVTDWHKGLPGNMKDKEDWE